MIWLGGLVGILAFAVAMLEYGGRWRAEDVRPTWDVVVVPGARVWWREGRPVPSPALARRVALAANLWKAGKVARILISGGTSGGGGATEAGVGALHALEVHGIPAAALLMEPRARTTAENAHYSASVLRLHGGGPFDQVLVATDSVHALRCRLLFQAAFGPDCTVGVVGTPPPFLARIRGALRELGGLALLVSRRCRPCGR